MFPYDKHVSTISYMIHMLAPFNNILFPYEMHLVPFYNIMFLYDTHVGSI